MGSLSMLESPWTSVKLPASPLYSFHSRHSNRSPIDSPPVAKKHLRVDETDCMSVTARTRRDQSSPGGPEEKENRSILKRHSGSSQNGDASRIPRHVDFQNSVLVFHFDRLEGDHVCSESQRLSVCPKDRKQFLLRTMHENRQKSAVASSGKPVFKIPFADDTTDFATNRSPTNSRTSQPEHRPLPTLPSSQTTVHNAPSTPDFSFYEDNERRLKIKFMVPLGPGVAANDVLVKANMTGNKVRVLATRTISTLGPRGRTTERQEFSERYQLPMEVDPYMITARMDSSGNLFVEAPVLTAERKKTLERERQKKTDAGFNL